MLGIRHVADCSGISNIKSYVLRETASNSHRVFLLRFILGEMMQIGAKQAGMGWAAYQNVFQQKSMENIHIEKPAPVAQLGMVIAPLDPLDQLVIAETLLDIIWPSGPPTRPSLEWLTQETKSGRIPFTEIAGQIQYNPRKVLEVLCGNKTVNMEQLVNGKRLLEIIFDESGRPPISWLRREVKKKTVPYVRRGRMFFFRPSSVTAWFRQKEVRPQAMR